MAFKHLLLLIAGYHYYRDSFHPLSVSHTLKTDLSNSFDFLFHMSTASIWSMLAISGFYLLLPHFRTFYLRSNAMCAYISGITLKNILFGLVRLMIRFPRTSFGIVVCIYLIFGFTGMAFLCGLLLFESVVVLIRCVKTFFDYCIRTITSWTGILEAVIGSTVTVVHHELARAVGIADLDYDRENDALVSEVRNILRDYGVEEEGFATDLVSVARGRLRPKE